MAQFYKFPCPNCQETFQVSVKQAGGTIACVHCESDISLPTMRGIKELEPVNDLSELGKKTKSRNSPLKAWLFAGGLLLAALAGSFGIALWVYADSLVTDVNVEERVAVANEVLVDAEPAVLWDAWHTLADRGPLPEWNENESQKYNKQAGYLRYISYGLLGLAGLGLLSMISSFMAKSK